MKKNIRVKKNLAIISMMSASYILLNPIIGLADEKAEAEFIKVTNKYNFENIIVENGISLRKGENLDLSQFPGWEISNNQTVEINNDIVSPINEGTVYLSNEIDGKVHIIEVYVPDGQPEMLSSQNSKESRRNYYKVFIDAGHGGSDSGASGFGNYEDELNLQVAKRVQSKLVQKGIEVQMSRTTDVFLSLSERANLANSYGADAFVSIHQNSASEASANGIETFHHTNKTSHKPLSANIQTNAIKETGAKDRGVKNANFAVLRETVMPSSLFESGFISNQVESANLANPAYQEKLANAIANGIEKYLKENINLNPSDDKVIATGTVNTTSLNVRSGYGTSNSVIGTLAKGAKVEILETQNGWHKIKYNTGYGYVSGSYIDLDSSEPETSVKQTKLTGNTRYSTAVKVSNRGWSQAENVIIVNSEAMSDALSATPFAKYKDAPILLTETNNLNAETKAEISRLKAKNVFIIGGTGVVNQNVANELKNMGLTVDRISGDDRYETSLAIAKRLRDISEIAVVNGVTGLPDAVSIAPVAANKNMPIVLASPNEGTKVFDEFIKSSNIKTSYVIGREGAISNEVANKLPNATRLGGIDRNETNSIIIDTFYDQDVLNNVFVAKDGMKNTSDLIDALAVGVLASKEDSPVVIVGNKISDYQKNVLLSKASNEVTQVGGNGNENAFTELVNIFNGK
ncbi:N-acetylmuramoyl-L-alanine amidase [Romboutsia sp.]|uniref:N-acetylmuramoyl-L-alanine amidase n=1 Tax=Romboutsia sp. TaxID=1965302 RepID=UPI003F340E90